MKVPPGAGLLGRIALHQRMLTAEQLAEAIRMQGRFGNKKKLGDILVEAAILTAEQLQELLLMQEQYLAKQYEAQQEAQREAQEQHQKETHGGRSIDTGSMASAERPPASQAVATAPAAPERPSTVRPIQVSRPPTGYTLKARPTAESHEVPEEAAQRKSTATGAHRAAVAAPPPQAAPPRPAPAPAPKPAEAQVQAGERYLDKILAHAVKLNASDVHIHSGATIQMRVHGKLLASRQAPLPVAEIEKLLVEILTPEQRERFADKPDLDFAYTIAGVGRFRCNIYRQQRGIDGVFRAIPHEPPTLESLGLPRELARLTTYHQGLVLVTGPAGCGKSSTLAALVNLINEERRDHIITVEDPIEYVHPSKKAQVNQRQVAKHTESFASALRAALREDPDVIAIGELRDLETVSLAITAAETGHLVLATLHTNNSVRTINRILDVFPPKQQAQVRAMVSESLRAIVSQRLLPVVDGSRRVPALEVLMVNPAVSNLIREEKTFQIPSILQTGRAAGMYRMDDSLQELVKGNVISKEVARRQAEDPKLFV